MLKETQMQLQQTQPIHRNATVTHYTSRAQPACLLPGAARERCKRGGAFQTFTAIPAEPLTATQQASAYWSNRASAQAALLLPGG